MITREEFEAAMQGIVCDTYYTFKDEAPQAYKDLSVFMENQKSLKDIVHQLLLLIKVKGFESKLDKK
jgi:tRNA-splicing ligase RtcB